jgi:quinol monooxygenase YgiN
VIALFIEHRTLPGRRADVEAVWERIMAPAVRDNRGHVLYAYCADDADPDVICAFQVYGDEAAATAFLQTDAYVDSAGTEPLAIVGSGVLRAGQAHALASDVVHAVMNRWSSPNGIVHVYAGNFLASPRHIWDPVTGERHDAGLSEPLAPSGTPAPAAAALAGPPLAGTAFAALSVGDVDAVTAWLSDALGSQALTTHDDTCAVGEEFAYLIEPSSLTIVGVHQAPPEP